MKHLFRAIPHRLAGARVPAIVSLSLAACAPVRVKSPVGDVGAGDLAPVLRPIRERGGLPALAGAIVTDRAIEHVGIVGVRKVDDPTPATLDDAFHLGSDTKAMTAVLVGKAVDAGKLAWTTTLAEVFPELASEMDAAYRGVTVDQLLAHRGGFPHHIGSSLRSLHALAGTMRERRAAYVRMALRTPPEAPPGTAFAYSNVGYTLLGAIVERRLDASWEDLITSVLFAPLDMKGAGFGAMGHPGQIDALWQHHPGSTVPLPVEPGPRSDNPLVIGPAGTVHVTMEGWGRFIIDQLRSFDGRGAVLTPATYAHLHTPLYGGMYVGGWGVIARPWAGGEAFNHNGSNTMNFAVAWMAPQRHFAVLVATNVGGDAAAKACNEAVGALVHMAVDAARAQPIAELDLEEFWTDAG
jgi:CubicO group peptidase (beta-lactamase class C family)